jgi:isopentenyldiphosphate isomerase
MEYFDVVDENGQPTGRIVEREKAHREDILHRTVHIWIVRKKGERFQVLLQKRSRNKDSFPGRYDTSSAGHIQAGDGPRQTACREIGEELGIRALPEDFLFVGHFRIHFAEEFHGKTFRDNEVVFVYIFRKPVRIRDLRFQEEEVEGAAWFDFDELLRLTRQKDPRFCVTEKGLGVLADALKNAAFPGRQGA